MQITIGDWSVVSLFSALSRKDRWLKGSNELVAWMLSSCLEWKWPWPARSTSACVKSVCHLYEFESSSSVSRFKRASARIAMLRVQHVTWFSNLRQQLTSAQLLAYCWVHCLAFSMASDSLFLQWSAIASSRGSSQLGADMRAWMERRTYVHKSTEIRMELHK